MWNLILVETILVGLIILLFSEAIFLLLLFFVVFSESKWHFLENRFGKKVGVFYPKEPCSLSKIIPVNNIFLTINDGKYYFLSQNGLVEIKEKDCEIIIIYDDKTKPSLSVYWPRYKNWFLDFIVFGRGESLKPKYNFILPYGVLIHKGKIITLEPQTVFVPV